MTNLAQSDDKYALREPSPQNQLSWSACIPTLNRFDILQINISCLLVQTRRPKQIIIVDAGDSPQQNREKLAPLFKDTGIEFILEAANAKSSAVQRNQALDLVKSEIVFFIDDDSLLFSDCAEIILAKYEADTCNQIAGIELHHVDLLPDKAQILLPKNENASDFQVAQKKGGSAQFKAKLQNLEKFAVWKFFRRQILMQARDIMFIPYDHYRVRPSANPLPHQLNSLVKVQNIVGYGMSVRTEIARKEPFNPFLLAYCPFEDADASYRYGRYGFCLADRNARLMHYEVQASRVTRRQATSLGISNLALFIHTNSDAPLLHRILFSIYVIRRTFGEFLKDLLTRRFTFPQTIGVISAVPRSVGIFRRPLPDAQKWYHEQQKALLARNKKAS